MTELNESILGSSIKLNESGFAKISGGALVLVTGADNMAQSMLLRILRKVREFRSKPTGPNSIDTFKLSLEAEAVKDARAISGVTTSIEIDRQEKEVTINLQVQIIREDNQSNDVITGEAEQII